MAIKIMSKGQVVEISKAETDEIRESGLGWHIYCQRRLTMTHSEAISNKNDNGG